VTRAVRRAVTSAAAHCPAALVAVGLSHRTASLALRERAALGEAASRALLGDLRSSAAVSAAAVLSTCNRTEVYAIAAGPGAVEALRGALAGRGRLAPGAVAAAGYTHAGEQAAAHLFRVAAGLDSMVVGEPEIQHQVRRAAALAAEEGALGPELGAVFRHALAAGRRARRETGIGRGAVSTASVCVALAERALGDLRGRRILVVGAGAMAESAARALMRHGAGGLVVANRTPGAARRLAEDLGGRGVGLAGLAEHVASADLVVACTGASAPLLALADVARAVRMRRSRPLVCIDLAVPHDIDPAAARLDGVVLLDLDDLRLVAEANRADRALEARRAEAIVAAEVARFVAGGRRASLATAA
jgi:glutamyl-tRNA reductase